MKKVALLALVVILSTSISASAKSNMTPKELFRDVIIQNLPFDKNGHVPYMANNEFSKSWQGGTGTRKVLVMLLDFPDETHRVKRDLFEDILISEKRMSLKKYYNMISNNRLDIDFGSNGIPDWHTLPKSYENYIKDNDYTYDDVVNAVTGDGMDWVKKRGVDISEYDKDGNGLPDITIFFLAGNSSAVGGYMLGDFTKTTDEKTIVIVAEDYAAGDYNSPTLIHEMGHAMIPVWDLYDYSYSSEPVGDWDIMGSGSWVGHCGMSGFTRWKAGWVDIKWIDQPGEYEIDDLNGDGDNKLYGIKIPGSEGEWMLLENREATGVEAYFNGPPGKGIACYQVDDKRPYDRRFNTLNYVSKTHGFMFLKLVDDKNILSSDTSPSSLPYVKVDKTTPNIGIRNATKPGETMKFTLSYDRPKLPVALVSNRIFVGKVVRNSIKTFEIPFQNIGMGTLYVILNTREKWLTLDRTSFIGNEETIIGTINAEGMKLGKVFGTVTFNNKSSESGGTINIEFDVVPIYGDLDSNNYVDDRDYKAFMKLYGLNADSPQFKPEADFNSDGVIDFTDLVMLAKNYKLPN